ncbi:unnamed protein product [marine sediment metagenome]|uniref:Uncharacterized protein n=1 Tax=marine sediment metagenome TaxID=412755 RepID=X1PDL4_9ZZZZ
MALDWVECSKTGRPCSHVVEDFSVNGDWIQINPDRCKSCPFQEKERGEEG